MNVVLLAARKPCVFEGEDSGLSSFCGELRAVPLIFHGDEGHSAWSMDKLPMALHGQVQGEIASNSE